MGERSGGSGVMLVRAWVQDGRLVARITWTVEPGEGDVGLAGPVEQVVAGAGRTVELVSRWLDAVHDGRQHGQGGPAGDGAVTPG